MTPYNKKIDVVVQSKKQEIFDTFLLEFSVSTGSFQDLRLIVIHPDLKVPDKMVSVNTKDFGAKVINQQIYRFLKDKRDIFGLVNDDLWLVKGWLEDIVELLETKACASAGYVETDDYEHYIWSVNKTEGAQSIIPLLYGGEYFFNRFVFKQIGVFDERFGWSCDDLDWAWRLELNNLMSATSGKITVGHQRCMTIPHNSKLRNAADRENKNKFYQKHGYMSYKELKRLYKPHYDYFQPYQYYTTHRNWVGQEATQRLLSY